MDQRTLDIDAGTGMLAVPGKGPCPTLAHGHGPSTGRFDPGRWRALERTRIDEPCEAMPQFVKRSSKGRPWNGLTVWHQVGPAEELYVAPASRHCLLVRRTSATELVQRQGSSAHTRRWQPGEVIIVPANTPSFWCSDSPRDNLHVDLAPEWLERVRGGRGPGAELSASFGVRDPVLVGLAQTLIHSLDSNASMNPLFADGIATSLAIHLLEHHARPAQTPEPRTGLSRREMQRIVELVRSHVDEPLSVQRLAAEVQLSSYHFARCFKVAFGVTPHAFVVGQRMERARQLLMQGRHSVLEAAQATGYASPAHFSQAFRAHWGLSPSALRRSGRDV